MMILYLKRINPKIIYLIPQFNNTLKYLKI